MKMLKNPAYRTIIFDKLCKKAIKKHKSTNFDDKFYSSLTRKYSDLAFGEKLKKDATSGLCYFYSLLLAGSFSGCSLKRGNLNLLNASVDDMYLDVFGHGWVEKDNLVYDTTAKQVFDKTWYYDNFQVEVKESYNYNEIQQIELFTNLLKVSIKDRQYLKNEVEKILANIEEERYQLEN